VQYPNTASFTRRLAFAAAAMFGVAVILSACTTAHNIGEGSKNAVKSVGNAAKEGVEALKEGGREVKRAIKEN
jgi:hypothetical protein